MNAEYTIVDLFAGPGGLAEGFSALKAGDGARPFRIGLSIEKEASAHSTLQFRAFLRQFGNSFPDEYYAWLNEGLEEPDWKRIYPSEWKASQEEALCLTLGEASAAAVVRQKVGEIRRRYGRNTVLIGGPPCQAYSLVGRARNRGIADYVPSQDHRHFLYREYIEILSQLEPAAFVMENVKGLLSATVDGVRMFDLITSDLMSPLGTSGYQLFAFSAKGASSLISGVRPGDFVVRAENFGVPQARHRVIIIGLRRDIAEAFTAAGNILPVTSHPAAHVSDVLDGMARLRSGLSRGADDPGTWQDALEQECRRAQAGVEQLGVGESGLLDVLREVLVNARDSAALPRKASRPNGIGNACPSALANWLLDERLHVLPNHETRGHMVEDLGRYVFSAAYAASTGHSPKAGDFPENLAPRHRNWSTGKFADRFRVQLRGQPSTTVTSHISKDGHYFIHPDPTQCRSLTVREAARLQTFPDNYVFRGNRTQQFTQVGNAVPPFLACQIAEAVWNVLSLADAGREPAVRVAA